MMAAPHSPTFVIHIGPHKTGTTYLQLTFRALRAELAARGTIFPECWELAPGQPSQLPLTLRLRDGQMDLLGSEFATLLASGAERILISSEDLSDLDRPGLERLRHLTAGYPIQVVFYVRRWSELIPSAWQESLKHGHSQTLPEFMLTNLERPAESRLLNFDIRLAPFGRVFGDASVTLVSYSELRDRNIDLFQHFAGHFLGWGDAPVLDNLQQSNSSRGMAEAELLRALNAMGCAHGMPRDVAIRQTFDKMPDRQVSPPLLEAMNRHIKKVRLSDSLPILQRLHESLVTKYISQMEQPKLAAHLFRPVDRWMDIVSGDYMAEVEGGAELRALFARVCAKLGAATSNSEHADGANTPPNQ